jgi:PAS domain S-box-containing protein
LRVLILEAHEPESELIVQAIRSAGFDCQWARVQSEAEFTRGLRGSLDMILSAARLPGFTAIRALELLQASGLDVPLVVVAGDENADLVIECLKRGAFDCINKDRLYRVGPTITHVLEERRHRAERARNERRLATLSAAVEHSAATIVITDPQGTIEYVNPQFTKVSGYSSDEVIGRNARILKSGVQSPALYAELWHTILSGREWRGELANRTKRGELYWERASISAVTDAHGAITHFLAVNYEMASGKIAEEALRQSEARTQLALAAARMGVWESDLKTGCLTWSVTLTSAFGLRPDQAPRTHDELVALIHPDDQAATREGFARAIRERTDFINELRVIGSDGVLRWIASRARLMCDEGGTPTRMIGVAVDITDRKAAETDRQRHHDELASQRLRVFRATMTTVQNIVNNFLASMQLIRLEADQRLSPETLALFDRLIREAATELQALGNLEHIREKDMIVGPGIDYPGSSG